MPGVASAWPSTVAAAVSSNEPHVPGGHLRRSGRGALHSLIEGDDRETRAGGRGSTLISGCWRPRAAIDVATACRTALGGQVTKGESKRPIASLSGYVPGRHPSLDRRQSYSVVSWRSRTRQPPPGLGRPGYALSKVSAAVPATGIAQLAFRPGDPAHTVRRAGVGRRHAVRLRPAHRPDGQRARRRRRRPDTRSTAWPFTAPISTPHSTRRRRARASLAFRSGRRRRLPDPARLRSLDPHRHARHQPDPGRRLHALRGDRGGQPDR